MARPAEPFGQDMLQDPPQELGPGNGPSLGVLALGVLIANGHLPVLASEEVLLADHAAIPIAPERHQRLLPGADALAIDDPFSRMARRQGERFAADGIEQLGAKDLGQGLVVEQIAAVALDSLGPPQPFVRIDGRGRNDPMHMGVVIEPARVGVQDGDGPGVPCSGVSL